MQIDFSIFALYVVAAIITIALPDPVAARVTGAGMAGGSTNALKTIFGMNAASLMVILLSAMLVKEVLAINESAFNLLKLAGACYIAYIGWRIFRESCSSDYKSTSNKPRHEGILKGFVIAISNPKEFIFFASFIPQFIDITEDTDSSIALLAMIWFILDFSTLALAYLLAGKILKPVFRRAMLRISGALLVVIAAGGIMMSAVELLERLG
ncbi:Lysine exporter protein (LYSE/YGGA) [Burkholderia sp. lig30]|jgi:threonine/homoserine/homoserine lactone efflux protein|uniref:LysE family translocator n=1 Tax=Burkholderia sp. lig30 TaxID=1192124 RepID=UPI000461556D|nr:LysE family translocator [Burkholderia sp. lig30]KDB08519.1 Lysine exporter protein (LYSE/YGGA) [Burkholderia sp. lig30]